MITTTDEIEKFQKDVIRAIHWAQRRTLQISFDAMDRVQYAAALKDDLKQLEDKGNDLDAFMKDTAFIAHLVNNIVDYKVAVRDTTRIINAQHLPYNWDELSEYLYVGRGSAKYPRLKASQFGNPFKDGSKYENILRYAGYLFLNPNLFASARMLVGKVLICHCWPDACHAEVLKAVAERWPRLYICKECGHLSHNSVRCEKCESHKITWMDIPRA